MLNADMKKYDYYNLYADDGYGQPILTETVQGSVIMAINTTSQNVQDNIKYLNATYIGLTLNPNIDDTYVIQYGNNTRLKVLYVQRKGIYKQVFMSEI